MNAVAVSPGKQRLLPGWWLWTVLAVLSWGIWALLSKVIGDALSPSLSQALSTLGLLPVMAALLMTRRLQVTGNRRRGVLYAGGAGVLACLGNMAYYDALNSGAKAATVVALGALYPVVTVLLAVTLLKERLNGLQIVGIVLSIVAIYLFNIPQGSEALSGWLTVALIPILVWGTAGLLQKLTTNHLSGELGTLWFLAAFIPLAGIILARQPWPGSIEARTWVLVIALGFTFALGNFALLAAFATGGKASVITPLAGLYPLVSIPIALLFFGERIGWREWAGIGLALAAVAALSSESKPASDPSRISGLKSEIPS